MPKCKVGDLAIILYSDFRENIGCMVNITRYEFDPESRWKHWFCIETADPVLWGLWGTSDDDPFRPERTRAAWAPDEHLFPIRPDDIDEDAETDNPIARTVGNRTYIQSRADTARAESAPIDGSGGDR